MHATSSVVHLALFVALFQMHAGVAGAEPIVLVKDGKPSATIVIADEPEPVALLKWTVADAAKVLQDYFKRVTGAELPIAKESEESQGNLILVGQTKTGLAMGIDSKDLPPEGYLVKAFERGVAIVGERFEDRDRGLLFGVYALLEQVAGIRWYFPGEMGTVIPKSSTLAISPKLNLSGAPFFKMRVGGVSHYMKQISAEWHPVLRFGGSAGMVANHTQEDWPNLYGKTHPEYFGTSKAGASGLITRRAQTRQIQAFLCYSEPGVLNQMVENVKGFLKSGSTRPWHLSVKPRGYRIPFGASDTRSFCFCERCKKRHTPERGRFGKSSDLIHDYVARYGDALKKVDPKIRLWSLAYDHYQLPPLKIDRFPDNVGITLCLIPCIGQTNHPGVKKLYRQTIEPWLEKLNGDRERLIIWDYFCYPNIWFTAPTEYPHVLADHIRYLKTRAIGMMNNGFNPVNHKSVPGLYLSYYISWLMHQLLWDPDVDVDVLREEYCRNLFGPASSTMLDFYRLLEERWEKTKWSEQPNSGLVKLKLVYGETYPKEVVDQLRTYFNKALQQTPPGSLYEKRLQWFWEKAHGPFFDVADRYHHWINRIPEVMPEKTEGDLRVDGILSERCWKEAEPLQLGMRVFGRPTDERSEVMTTWDDRHLYIAARFQLKDADSLKAEAETASQVPSDDAFVVQFRRDKKAGYGELLVNAKGITLARLQRREGNWNPENIKASSRVHGSQWTTEITVPWKALPTPAEKPHTLRVQFIRKRHNQRYTFDCWSPILASWWGSFEPRFGRLKVQ